MTFRKTIAMMIAITMLLMAASAAMAEGSGLFGEADIDRIGFTMDRIAYKQVLRGSAKANQAQAELFPRMDDLSGLALVPEHVRGGEKPNEAIALEIAAQK